ncbi:P-loop containing nucleoside triphosphate hydrolase protein [Cercophora newfieldiana]|uniref:P-loop containing nucleoside triphosphate hydrolase protein n=1 Tax=Cercophora newfieldiana TaxID=92897 RepID=A0AA39YGK0_9PEZI|nr:P-loop containing nucleoside triphosphate hydrolase protein [Cercophora newfieldiana]
MTGWRGSDHPETEPRQPSAIPHSVVPVENDKLPDEAEAPHVGPDDIVIAVMGMTGAGKSTFISHFSKSAVVGDSLMSCTSKISIHPARINGKDVFLVDTPGFDDTNRSDALVLGDVADWLNRSFQTGVKISGIIYLHRITDNRVGGSAAKNLVIFKKLLGEAGYSCVVIATTYWDAVSPATGERREQELKENTRFWKELIRGGSQVWRQDSGATSAARIIEHIMSKQKRVTLQIQVEMANGAALGDTEAGSEVNSDLKKLEKRYKQDLQTLQADMATALKEKDDETRILLEETKEELTAEMKKVEADKEKLQLDMSELRRQRAEDIAREREEAHRQHVEHQKHMEEQMAKSHEQELAHQKAMADGNLKLQIQLAENKHQEELIKARMREHEAESRIADLERMAHENNRGGCLVM